MSNSSDLRVSMIAEVTPGTTPASPAMKILPVTGQSMEPLIRYLESRTIRANRNVADAVPGSRSSGGALPAELRWASSSEALFEAVRAIMCAASEDAEVDVTGCSTVSGTKNITRPTGDFTTVVKVGDVIRHGLNGGGMAAADEGFSVVTSVSALTLTVKRTSNFSSNNTGIVLVRRGARMDNGTTARSFALEIARLDINQYRMFNYAVFNEMNIRVASGSLIEQAFGIVAGNMTVSGSGYGASYTNPANRPVMASTDVPIVSINGVEYEVTDVSMNVSNNAAARERVGALGVTSIRRGQFRVSGSVTLYLSDSAELSAFLANTARDMFMVQKDTTGAAWSFALPNFKWTQQQDPTSGPNQDDFLNGSFLALEDATQGYTMRTQRFSA